MNDFVYHLYLRKDCGQLLGILVNFDTKFCPSCWQSFCIFVLELTRLIIISYRSRDFGRNRKTVTDINLNS